MAPVFGSLSAVSGEQEAHDNDRGDDKQQEDEHDALLLLGLPVELLSLRRFEVSGKGGGRIVIVP